MFNLPLVPHYLSMSVLSGADRIMIRNMVAAREAGIYNLAYNISLIMTMFNTALMQTIEPWLYIKIKQKRIEDLSKVAYTTFILIAGMNVMLMALAPEVVTIFAPSTYHEAIYVIPPVAMSVYFMYAYSFFAVFEFYYEKTNLVMIATTLSAALNILLNYIFIKLFGYIAAGYTTLVCYILYAAFHYIFMRRLCNECLDGKQPYDLRILLLISALFVCVGFVFLMTYDAPAVRYALLLIIVVSIILKRSELIETIKNLLALKKEGNAA